MPLCVDSGPLPWHYNHFSHFLDCPPHSLATLLNLFLYPFKSTLHPFPHWPVLLKAKICVNQSSCPLASCWFWPMGNDGRWSRSRQRALRSFTALLSLSYQVALCTHLSLQIVSSRIVDDKTLSLVPVPSSRGCIPLDFRFQNFSNFFANFLSRIPLLNFSPITWVECIMSPNWWQSCLCKTKTNVTLF